MCIACQGTRGCVLSVFVGHAGAGWHPDIVNQFLDLEGGWRLQAAQAQGDLVALDPLMAA